MANVYTISWQIYSGNYVSHFIRISRVFNEDNYEKILVFFCTHCTATTTTAAKQFVQRNKSRINRSLSAVGLAALTHPISDVHYCKYIHVNSSDMSLHFKLAKPSADRVFTDSESQTVGAATVEARDATEASTRGR